MVQAGMLRGFGESGVMSSGTVGLGFSGACVRLFNLLVVGFQGSTGRTL